MQIFGFGQLTDITINPLSDFQVFIGDNEAGKSTIMAFIHAILFGFPTKQQNELRYEPKHNSRYGGRLKIYTEDHGVAVIERVKGKTAVGDVTVSTENGEIGGEDLLKKLLVNVDKGLFQAIFSFNLHGLQNIHQMKREEIGKFLFSAGTLGTDRLAIADSELQKELDFRFKPGGKKPVLNGKLQEINQLHRDLKEAAAKNQAYETLVQQKETLQNEMVEMNEQLQQLQEKINKLNEWKKIEPLVKEQKLTKEELSLMGDFSFPLRGIERFEKLKPLLSSAQAQLLSLQDRISRLEKEIEAKRPNKLILENEFEIQTELEKYPLYNQWNLQAEQLKIKCNQYENQLAEIKEKLHLSLTEEEILLINTNISMKNLAEQLSKKGQVLEEIKLQLENRFNEEKNALETLEEELQYTQGKLLPEPERQRLEKQLHDETEQNNLEMKLRGVREKIEIYKKAEQKERNALAGLKRQRQIQYLLFTAVLIGLIFYGFYSSQKLPLILGGIGAAAVLIVLIINRPQSKRMEENDGLTKLFQEEQQLMQLLKTYDFRKLSEIQEQLLQDNRYRERLKILGIKLEEQHNQYEKVIQRFEEWELEAADHKEEVKRIARQLKIPEQMANSFLLAAFGLIEQYKTAAREKQQLKENLKTLNANQKEIFDKMKDMAERYLDNKNIDCQEAAYLLRNKLKEEQETRIQWKEMGKKLTELTADFEQIKEEHRHLSAELNKLLQIANAETETEFYELGIKAEKKEKLLVRLEDLKTQLHYSFLTDLERESCLSITNSNEIINRYNQEASDLQSRLTRLQEQQASINYEIQKLEEGGLYSELLHQFKEKKYELEEDAKEWAVYCLAKNVLTKTVEKYKNIHLPRMISKAEEFLSFLTEGNYQKILLHETGSSILIVRKDQTIFEANELSQATTEQVYVSIRLALALTIYEKYHFPIIIDDSFVNFDKKRTKKMIDLLKSLKNNQILFFTCHEHLLNYFGKENILSLNKGAVQFL